MLNPYVLRRYSALLMSGLFTTIGFYLGITLLGFVMGLLVMFGTLLFSLVMGNLLLKNPFRQMMEGKGLMVFKLDSTGIIKPFIMQVSTPYIQGKVGKRWIKDIFNRSTVSQLAEPKNSLEPAIQDKDGISVKLNETEYNDARFALFHRPCLIWNDQLKSFLTKDTIAGIEKDYFAEHGILYLKQKMDELSAVTRDFARHVIDTMKPQTNIFKSKWFVIVLVIGMVILGLLFLPSIVNVLKGFSAPASNVISSTGGAVG